MLLETKKNSFHAQHSAVGAHFSFTMGMHGVEGGLALEKGDPALGAVYVGAFNEEEVDVFPFFRPNETSDVERFDHQKKNKSEDKKVNILKPSDIQRTYSFASDKFESKGMTFEVVSPFYAMKDPKEQTYVKNKRDCAPSIFIKFKVDNRSGTKVKQGAFALHQHGCPLNIDDGEGFKGFVFQNGELGISTIGDARSIQILDFSETYFPDFNPRVQGIGTCFGFLMDVPAGEEKEILVCLSSYKEGRATLGMEMPYWYTRFFTNIEDVMRYSLDHSEWYLNEATQRDTELEQADLNDAQKFLIAHASHSYYGSTQWFDHAGEPFWNVNEGEYQMINTFDLTVDMIFYEMKFSPWTVKNVLKSFVEHYSYYDEAMDPNEPEKRFPGGLSFTHDMGNRNMFTPKGHSSYEVTGLDRKCFSYMTHEQLVNWICCAGVYWSQTSDEEFLQSHAKVLKDALESLLNRDHYDPEQRDGVMSMESSRCGTGGGEITTYDSLDHSLGQARRNLYLAVKTWGAYLALDRMLAKNGNEGLAKEALIGAKRASQTIANHYDSSLGYIPAVFDADEPSAIIPGIEGLVFPSVMGMKEALSPTGEYGEMIKALEMHFINIFKVGICQYEDKGWKLSSTADNSWMSKISICQYVAREVLGLDFGDEQHRQDEAHQDWQIYGSTYNACSDQFVSGVAMGSLYYPRIVSNILWMSEKKAL
jgi:hypothetical protein